MATECEGCGLSVGDKTQRYCGGCRKIVRSRMHKSGYLQQVPRTAYDRTIDDVYDQLSVNPSIRFLDGGEPEDMEEVLRAHE